MVIQYINLIEYQQPTTLLYIQIHQIGDKNDSK